MPKARAGVRSSGIMAAALALILLITVPVGGAPGLQKGSQAIYNLSASISFFQFCQESPSSGIQAMTVCPMIVTMPSSIDINGTLGWTATNLTSTTASLNVTRNVTVSSSDDTTIPVIHRLNSFNESVNLATRIISITPFFIPEIAEALQMAQTSMGASFPAGVDLSSSMSVMEDSMLQNPMYTMWWVNGPLAVNQTVPILVFPTNVTGTSSVNLGSLGTRTAWTLSFSLARFLPLLQPGMATMSPVPTSNSIEVALTFNYDQKSDLLLSATADVHFGFLTETTIQPAQCGTTTTLCSTTSTPIIILHQFAFNIQASLTLANTNLNLNQRLSSTGSSSDVNTGSGSGSGTGTGSGSGSSTGSGTPSNSGSGTGSNTGNGPSSNGQSSKPQPTFMFLPAGLTPWTYGILGIVAAAILGTGLWIAARRRKGTPSENPPTQTSV